MSFARAVAQYQAGDRAAARDTARRLLDKNPADPDALNLLSILAQDEKQWAAAEDFALRALKAQPGNPILLNSLGNALIAQGRTDDAIAALVQAAAAAPHEADILFNLGNAYREAGRTDDAVEHYRKTIELKPGHIPAYNNLAVALRSRNDPESALTVLIEALAFAPKSAELRFNVGNAMRAVGRLDAAEVSYRRALELNPTHAEARVNLGAVLVQQGRRDEAEAEFRKAIALDPDLAPAYVGLADLIDNGDMNAVAHRRAVLALKPDLAAIRSSLLMCLQYDPAATRAEIAEAHRAYGALLERGGAPAFRSRPIDLAPDRPLRVGVISGDFRFHAMLFFACPVFLARDRAQWHLTCYSTTPHPDGFTNDFRAAADRWRDVRHLDTGELVRLIVADGIDILIDLAGHTPHNRLPAFAARPAPLQVAWGDYVDTRGLTGIDVLLGDAIHTPPSEDSYYVEQVVRLPGDYLCYRPPAYAPPVSPAPMLARGHITFGCFSEVTKINPAGVARWAAVLRAVPTATFVANNRLFADGATQGKLLSQFMEAGIGSDRVRILTGGAHEQFLAQYGEVDVILDTAPYSGGLTTCEALLMGVPVLSVPGDRFCSRHAAAHLTYGGYPDGVCTDAADMAAKAAALAADGAALDRLRQGLRARFIQSPVCDVTGFAHGFYDALRAQWRTLCAART